jgi:hypothetical protein
MLPGGSGSAGGGEEEIIIPLGGQIDLGGLGGGGMALPLEPGIQLPMVGESRTLLIFSFGIIVREHNSRV